MSRLQVGGLALIIGSESGFDVNCGRVVELVKFVGALDSPVAKHDDYWVISCENLHVKACSGKVGLSHQSNCSAKYLMPLGDKQTQDELAKEKGVEWT